MLEVKGRPIIDYIVDKLESVPEVDGIIVVTNSKFIAKFRKWKKTLKIKKPVLLIDDLTKSNTDRLGAIGDVAFVIRKQRMQEDILVIGGDNLFSGGLAKFVDFAVSKRPASTIGLYKLRDLQDASSYGVARLDRRKRVIYFEEKPAKPKSKLVAMCLYYIPAGCLKLIREYMKIGRKADATGNYIDWLKSRMDTYGFIFRGSWYDIGDFKYLTRAKKYFA